MYKNSGRIPFAPCTPLLFPQAAIPRCLPVRGGIHSVTAVIVCSIAGAAQERPLTSCILLVRRFVLRHVWISYGRDVFSSLDAGSRAWLCVDRWPAGDNHITFSDFRTCGFLFYPMAAAFGMLLQGISVFFCFAGCMAGFWLGWMACVAAFDVQRLYGNALALWVLASSSFR